jgi:hypothetical protein
MGLKTKGVSKMSGKCRKLAALLTGGFVLMAISLVEAMNAATAAEWSDTSIGWRYGTMFREPVNKNNISKNIVDFQHASGYKYGTNFFNIDLLMSDSKDPSTGNSSAGAREVYIVYRNTVALSKVTGSEYKFGIVRDIGGTFGFDWNTKNDVGYSSKKRMLVAGPTLIMDVPGFLNVSVLVLNESNAPIGVHGRYTYKTHPELDVVWGIPFGDSPFNFQGYCDYIAAKGTNEFGGGTAPEIHFDGAIMLDLGRVMGGSKNTFKVGFEYEYWKNKFGNDNENPFYKDGATAKTPMIRAEYHF